MKYVGARAIARRVSIRKTGLYAGARLLGI